MSTPDGGPSAVLRARVLGAVRRHPAPPRRARAFEGPIALSCGFGLIIPLWVRLGVYPGARPLAYIVALVAAWLLVALVASWAGVSRGRSMLGRAASWKASVAILTPVALLALWWPLAEAWPSTLVNDSGWFNVLECTVGTGLLAIGPLLAFLFVNRRSEPVRPWLSGAAFGAAAGGWGAVPLVVICRHASAPHMIFGHVAPVGWMALVGAALGRWALAIRFDHD
ncbi:MAG: NrsF family protein [Polyangiaceae bacterium]|nr:NrsF family protein [Polyangiaceae bacterium]